MKVSEGIHCWLRHHKLHSKSTLKTYQSILPKLATQIGERDLNSITSITISKAHAIPLQSGKESEIVFILQKVADRLKAYIGTKEIGPDQWIFPISYTAAGGVVRKAGKVVGIHLRPHDLRRHAATYASRSGVPIEIGAK